MTEHHNHNPSHTGSFLITDDGNLETEIVLHLNPHHPYFKKLMYILEGVQKKQKGLITYSSGL